MIIVATTVYSINDDGQETKIGDNVGLSTLIQGHVFIAIDNNAKKIYIWKGHESPVRQKFISARTASKIRQSYGMVYKVESIDQGEEPADFIALMGSDESPVQPPLVTSSTSLNGSVISTQPVSTTSSSTMTSTTTPIASARPANVPIASARPANAPIASTQSTNIHPSQTSASSPPITSSQQSSTTVGTTVSSSKTPAASTTPIMTKITTEKEIQVTPSEDVSQDLLNIVIDKLRELDEPEGMQREIVIIKNRVYSCTKDFHKLFKKEILRLDPMDDLPLGAFPASDYYTRLFIDETGKVLFIELFAEIPRTERDEFLSEVRASLRDLTKLGI